MTRSRLENVFRNIRHQLFDLHKHAETFGISESIQAASLEDLKKIVTKYIEETKNDE